jgi:tetratricopeptide (TPR) repeat protein
VGLRTARTGAEQHASVQAQVRYTTEDKKAIKAYEEGADLMRVRDLSGAEQAFNRAIKVDPRFVEPRVYLAEMEEMKGNDQAAIDHYRVVLSVAPRLHPMAQFHLADLEFRTGQYDAAEKNYTAFLEKELDPQRKEKARLGLDNCAFARRALQQPVPFEPVNLGPRCEHRTARVLPHGHRR